MGSNGLQIASLGYYDHSPVLDTDAATGSVTTFLSFKDPRSFATLPYAYRLEADQGS